MTLEKLKYNTIFLFKKNFFKDFSRLIETYSKNIIHNISISRTGRVIVEVKKYVSENDSEEDGSGKVDKAEVR